MNETSNNGTKVEAFIFQRTSTPEKMAIAKDTESIKPKIPKERKKRFQSNLSREVNRLVIDRL